MALDKKKYNLLKSFLDTYEAEGVCEFQIIDDEEDDSYSVIIVFDVDWLKSIPTKVEFITRRYRKGMKEEILNFTGLDVPYIGSTARKCNESLLESLSPRLRRRISFDSLKNELDYSVLEEMDPCQFRTPGEFIAESCDYLKDIILDNISIYDNTSDSILSRDKDQLYYHLVNTFESYLLTHYRRMCR